VRILFALLLYIYLFN